MNDLKSFELTWIKRTNIPKDLGKNRFFTERAISLNKLFKKLWFFTEQTISLYERFYWTIIPWKSERLWTIHFWERKKSTIEKKMNEMGCSRKMNDRNKKKSNVTISTAHFWCNTSSIKKPWADVFERCEII